MVIAVNFFVQITHAVEQDQNRDCLPYTIVFGNGIANTREDAKASRNILTSLVGTTFHNVNVNYTVAYNPTNGPGAGTLLDVVDVIKQKSEENNSLWSLSWKVIFGVVSKTEPNQS